MYINFSNPIFLYSAYASSKSIKKYIEFKPINSIIPIIKIHFTIDDDLDLAIL